MQQVSLKEKLAVKDKWVRALYLLLFGFINYFLQILSWAVALFQLVAYLFVEKPNQRLCNFGKQLSGYSYQILLFLTFNSDKKPYPFSDWPKQEDKNSPHSH